MQLLRLAEILLEDGQDVLLVGREGLIYLPHYMPKVELFDAAALINPGKDIWLVPEGWPNSLLPGFNKKAVCFIYVQNWAHLFSAVPKGLNINKLPVDIIAVSDPVAYFVERFLGKRPHILRPGIDLDLFKPPAKKFFPRSRISVRVAYMPRKNKYMLEGIKKFSQALDFQRNFSFEWLEISGLSPQDVADKLRAAHIFLSVGFPEGIGLPPLEAMACGCIPVGFTGLGGFDYMRQFRANTYLPTFPLRETVFSGNGFYVEDANIPGAAMALEEAGKLWVEGGEELENILEAGQRTAKEYSLHRQKEVVLEFWRELRETYR